MKGNVPEKYWDYDDEFDKNLQKKYRENTAKVPGTPLKHTCHTLYTLETPW